MRPEDLDLVETSTLFRALARRFKGLLLVHVADVDAEREAMRLYWHGGRIMALGLAEYAAERVRTSFAGPNDGPPHDDEGNPARRAQPG